MTWFIEVVPLDLSNPLLVKRGEIVTPQMPVYAQCIPTTDTSHTWAPLCLNHYSQPLPGRQWVQWWHPGSTICITMREPGALCPHVSAPLCVPCIVPSQVLLSGTEGFLGRGRLQAALAGTRPAPSVLGQEPVGGREHVILEAEEKFPCNSEKFSELISSSREGSDRATCPASYCPPSSMGSASAAWMGAQQHRGCDLE